MTDASSGLYVASGAQPFRAAQRTAATGAMNSRPSFLAAAMAAVFVCVLSAAPQSQQPNELRLTFLGTAAGPAPDADLAGASTLVEFGSELLVIDVGRGAVQRLQQANVNPTRVTGVFLTHLHSDHTVGLPEL